MDIPGYRDIVEIGRGRASTVYRAVQDASGRPVAIKVLNVSGVEERLRRRFERETDATHRLAGHPNIAEVLDTGSTDAGHPYVTTPFYDHGSLDDRLARTGPLPVDEVLRIGARLAGALGQVHRAGILHRDVKPSNVLVSGDGEPALTGFGISAIDPDSNAMTMAQSFAAVHTPPEVILGQPATEATDTYQLASTLYTLLAGWAPFQVVPDDGIVALLGRIQSAEVPGIDRPDVVPGLLAALRAALAKDPADRPGPQAFAEALLAYRDQELTPGPDPAPPTPAPPAATAPSAPPPSPPADPYAAAGPVSPPPVAPGVAPDPAPADLPAVPVSWEPPAPPSPPAPAAPPPPSYAPAAPAPPAASPGYAPAPPPPAAPAAPPPPFAPPAAAPPPLPGQPSPAPGGSAPTAYLPSDWASPPTVPSVAWSQQTVRYDPSHLAPMPTPNPPPAPVTGGGGSGRLLLVLVIVALLAAAAAVVALLLLR